MGMKKGLFRLSLIISALLLVVGGILPSIGAAAADVVKIEKTYDIAVAYDNSGSMYDNDDRWCKAKFAMEIFASMLDYKNGDKLTVFPMWEVVTDGSMPPKPEYNTLSTTPIEIRSVADINKITNMYTPRPGDTPVSVVTQAANYLRRSSASEKWLVVLTDGDFIDDEKYKAFDDPGRKLVIPNNETKDRLLNIADDGINVQYFMVGSLDEAVNKDKIKSEPQKNLYAEYAETSQELQEKLIGICNKIFQRDELVGELSGDYLKLEISMKSLIVFVQGEGAKINSLKDKNGNPVEIISDSTQRKYSEYSMPGPYDTDRWGNEYAPITDTSLYGQVVTFGECAVGAYTLDITGADKDKIKIFYEPDVDMKVDVYDKDGNVVDLQDSAIIAGDYIVKAKLVDAKTGSDITKSPLMGNDVKFDLKVTYDGKSPQKFPVDIEKGSVVSLTPGEKIDTVVTGTYLKDYKISSEDDPAIFPGNIVVIDPEDGLKIKADVLQENNWYQLSTHKDWKPVRVDLQIDGAPLTDEQLEATVFDIKAESGKKNKNGESLKYQVELLKGESAINIHLAKDSDDSYVAPNTGKYKLKISATTIANTGLSITANDKVSFDIQLLPLIVVWAIAIASILLLIFLIVLYMNQKVLPRDIEHVSTNFMREGDTVEGLRASVKYSKKGKKGKITISTPPTVPMDATCRATLKLQAVDKRYIKSAKRRVKITDISSANNAVVINNYTYEKSPANGKFIDPLQPELPGGQTRPINKICKLVVVEIQAPTASLVCNVKNK